MKNQSKAMAFSLTMIFTADAWRAGYSDHYLLPIENYTIKQVKCDETGIGSVSCKGKNIGAVYSTDSSGAQSIRITWLGHRKKHKFDNPVTGNLELYIGEFNNDGIMDGAFVRNSGGSGLGAELCDVLFLVSDKNDFRFASFQSFGFDKKNFIQPDGKKRIYQTIFAQVHSHGFWIHRLYVFSPNDVTLDGPSSDYWMPYADNPDHMESPLESERDSILANNPLARSFQKKISTTE